MNAQTRQEKREALTLEIRQAAKAAGMDTMDNRDLLLLLAATAGLTEWAASDTLLRRGADSVPALIEGLGYKNGKVRAVSALLLDHVADDRCIEPLLYAIRHDALEAVRRCALHSLVCDGCKACPLSADVIGALIEAAENDRSLAVRRRAVFYLSMQRPDARIAPYLQSVIARSADSVLLRRAAHALRQHS